MAALALIYFRSFHACYIVLGGIVAAVSAKILKNIIRQPRPAPLSKALVPQAKGYGMPSSHSQVVAYFGVYLQLLLIISTTYHPFLIITSLVALNAFCCSIYLSRVRLGNHTLTQVVAGGILGALIAIAWYAMWRTTVSPWLYQHGQLVFKDLLISFHLDPIILDYIHLY
jgi:dolichyldiphosphatase